MAKVVVLGAGISGHTAASCNAAIPITQSGVTFPAGC